MFEKVGIVVLNWNNKNDTAKCLYSLQKIIYSQVEIILVDNGSTDDSVKFFRETFPEYTLIEAEENLGYAGGNNVGITRALQTGCEKILLLNNDTTVHPLILDAFLKDFEKYPKAGILGGKIYLMDDPNRFDHFGGNWNPKTLCFDYIGFRQIDDPLSWTTSQEIDYVCGASMMIKRTVFEKIGFFDPRFFLLWEESDFCFRAKKAGFVVRTCPNAKIWHKVSASFSGKNHTAYFFWRNRLLWIECNMSGFDRFFYLCRLIGKNLVKFYLQQVFRYFQYFLQILAKKDTKRNRQRILRHDAILSGIHDYLFRRFGSGRSKNFMNCL